MKKLLLITLFLTCINQVSNAQLKILTDNIVSETQGYIYATEQDAYIIGISDFYDFTLVRLFVSDVIKDMNLKVTSQWQRQESINGFLTTVSNGTQSYAIAYFEDSNQIFVIKL